MLRFNLLFVPPEALNPEHVALVAQQVCQVGERRLAGQRVAVDVDAVALAHLQVAALQRHVVGAARDRLFRLRHQHDLLQHKHFSETHSSLVSSELFSQKKSPLRRNPV